MTQGALEPLIQLLRTGDEQGQSDAADALASLSLVDALAEAHTHARARLVEQTRTAHTHTHGTRARTHARTHAHYRWL